MDLLQATRELQRGVEASYSNPSTQREGLHYGAQLAVYHGGKMVDLCAAMDQAMTSEHVLCWSSSVKPLMTIALAQLQDLRVEKGLLDFDDAVSKFLPSFTDGGSAKVRQHICRQPLVDKWLAGQRRGYDSPAWYAAWQRLVLAGVVSAADPQHRSYADYVEEEIFQPLNLGSCSIGAPEDPW
eukprot:Skav210416  [mRNA]  locus=scaffold1573:144492:148587:- [translate_table: standard]